MKRELVVRSAVIDWIEENLTITDLEEKKHVLPLDKNIHVVMEGFPVPALEERDMQARELGAFMSRGYIIEKISYDEEEAYQPTAADLALYASLKSTEVAGAIMQAHVDGEMSLDTYNKLYKVARDAQIAVETVNKRLEEERKHGSSK